MVDGEPRYPSDDSLGLIAALRRAQANQPGIRKAMRDGRVSPRLFNVPKELPVNWTYVEATALALTIAFNDPQNTDDVRRIAAEALPEYIPDRAFEIAEACIRWGASLSEP